MLRALRSPFSKFCAVIFANSASPDGNSVQTCVMPISSRTKRLMSATQLIKLFILQNLISYSYRLVVCVRNILFSGIGVYVNIFQMIGKLYVYTNA